MSTGIVSMLIPIAGIVMGAAFAFYAARNSNNFCRNMMLTAAFTAAGNAGVVMAVMAKVGADATLAVIGITAAETAAIAAVATIAVYCALFLWGKRTGTAAVI